MVTRVHGNCKLRVMSSCIYFFSLGELEYSNPLFLIKHIGGEGGGGERAAEREVFILKGTCYVASYSVASSCSVFSKASSSVLLSLSSICHFNVVSRRRKFQFPPIMFLFFYEAINTFGGTSLSNPLACLTFVLWWWRG